MIIEGEVNSDRIGSNNDREGSEAPAQTSANSDPLFMREQISKVFNLWSEISRLPTVGPLYAYSQYSRSELTELVELGKTILQLQIHFSEYWVQINNTYVHALTKAAEKAPKKYDSKQDFEDYRKAVIDVFEDEFTALFDSQEFARSYSLVLSQQLDLFNHIQKLTEKSLRVLNLPTRAEVNEMVKDVHDLKKEVHDLTRKMEAMIRNDSRNIPA
ncbi:MAG TPA: poly(R)-hydroxyalkanoic acid synthase subunit PhaE [Candidatus Nitrosopolaris sp.]|nr:poly(R)-hydroxyalkanoic acid synthase subunit PhaE [Candidatus Nitrosopolaris sp.]